MRLDPRWPALAGLTALAAYIIACGPAFSPDGSQILAPVLKPGPDSSELRVERYNLVTRKLETPVYLETTAAEGKDLLPSVTWTPDGRDIVLLLGEDSTLRVTVIPVTRDRPVRVWRMEREKSDEMLNLLVEPSPIVGRQLFLGGGSIGRIDLDSGETLFRPLPGNAESIRLLKDPRGILYILGKTNGAGEIGRLAPDDLAITPTFELMESHDSNGTRFSPFFAPSPDATRLALGNTDERGQTALLVYKGSTVAQRLPLGPTNAPVSLGSLAWSKDAKTLLALAFREAIRTNTSVATNAPPLTRVALLEVPVDGGSVRETALFEVLSSKDDMLPLLVQMALSPSPESTILAVANTVMTEKPDPDWTPALHLVDLASPQRTVTRIPMGPPAAAKSKP